MMGDRREPERKRGVAVRYPDRVVHVESGVGPGEHRVGVLALGHSAPYERADTARRKASVSAIVSCAGHGTKVPSGRKPPSDTSCVVHLPLAPRRE
jgi:hypothetical protein